MGVGGQVSQDCCCVLRNNGWKSVWKCVDWLLIDFLFWCRAVSRPFGLNCFGVIV